MSTYATLTQDIQDWQEDDNSEFTSNIDNFIAMAEERIFRDVPFMPQNRFSNTGNLSSGTATLAMPSGVRNIRSISITVSSSTVVLQQRLDSYLQDAYPTSATTGQPKYYSIQSDTSLLFAPTPNSAYAYEVLAYKKPTGLSSGNTTTWLSTNAEEILLFSCLVEATGYLQQPEESAVWEARYQTALSSLQSEMMRTLGNENTVGV
tara:strand:+ start:1068 stop:1685 length:618 start_codon:yes stop_codon:yes gene_type:complete